MTARDIIAAKRDGRVLTREQIRFMVQGAVAGSIPDYQLAAWLMAITLRGMVPGETAALTLEMRDSGAKLDLSSLPGTPVLDKHSTGGVGDKTSLIAAPMLAAAGIPILKMSGRALGFSGGTIDKLESIPGLRTEIPVQEAVRQMREIGLAIISQSAELAPADKIFYALRDATATVESIPLIAASIMSKKLASGAQAILLDVKVGRGAFMKDLCSAEELARTMVELGAAAGVRTLALLTGMDQPLGRCIGNALEVREAIAVLRSDPGTEWGLRGLCIELAAHGLVAAGKSADMMVGRARAESLLSSGVAGRAFEAMVRAQGGPNGLDAIEAALPSAPIRAAVRAERSGVVADWDAGAVGKLVTGMGAGREAKGDTIDPAVGMVIERNRGEPADSGDVLATLHIREADRGRVNELVATARAACELSDSQAPLPVIPRVIRVVE